jgi:FkbM family methyltransferase
MISTNSPLPIASERLSWLIENGVDVRAVLDVGVQFGTPFLMESCKHLPHLLFEPVDDYIPAIHRKYAGFEYEVFHAAVSDRDGVAWQLGYSADSSGRVTHSQISDRAVDADGQNKLVSCKEISMRKLDTIMADRREASPYLLKIDVDGHEIPILNGAQNTLKQSSIVIVEAQLSTIVEKTLLLRTAGFTLFDIVDLCYYYGRLSQVDLIFVSNSGIERSSNLRPWQTKAFDWGEWAPLSKNQKLLRTK